MPSYKLTYFNGRGRAEVSRYMLAMNDVPFEDVRLDMDPTKGWDKLKPSTPFGQLPLLETDGFTMCQSTAIERLIARRHNLYGSNEREQARSDEVVACAEDMLTAMIKVADGILTEQQKAEYKKKCEQEVLPGMLTHFEKMINADGLFISKTIQWADISVAHILTFTAVYGLTVDMTQYPKLTALKAKVESQSKIAAWIKQRKETPF